MNERIHVWRDTYGAYEHVGLIEAIEDHATFYYDRDYHGPAISVRLPIGEEPFSERDTEIFFSALVPEGQTRIDFLDALRAGRSEYSPLLERLNDELSGGLVFSVTDSVPGSRRAYSPLEPNTLEMLARMPEPVAMDVVGKTRLSLAGAMAKVGLYRDEATGEWLLPKGTAPSTHIVKAGNNGLFPYKILNEALCLELARLCDLPVEEFELMGTDAGPLLAVRRFDRPIPEFPLLAGRHELPMRLHQEDLCQAGGTKLKYEPMGANYLRFAVSIASRSCKNHFGNAMMVLYYTAFSYLVGNCDNHLKNISLLYSADWADREVAPLYDVLDTTVYGRLKDTMGISLAPNRSIFGVRHKDVERTIVEAGLPADIALREFSSLTDEALKKFDEAVNNVAGWGYPEVERLASIMQCGMRLRASFAFDEDARETVA